MTELEKTLSHWHGATRLSRMLINHIRAPDYPAKLRWIRAFCRAFYKSGIPLVNANGTCLAAPWDDWLGWSLIVHAEYEPHSLALATELLRGGGVVVDVGAHIGLYTVTLSALAGVECVAIEPFGPSFSALRKNIAVNQRHGHCHLVNLAVSDQPGELQFEMVHPGNSGTNRVRQDTNMTLPSKTVAADTLENILRGTPVGHIDLLKMDIEGYEKPALEGLDFSGKWRPAHVIIEFSDYGKSLGRGGEDWLWQFFTSRGYEARQVDGSDFEPGQGCLETNLWFADSSNCAA